MFLSGLIITTEAGVCVTTGRFQLIIDDFVMSNALANRAAACGAIALTAAGLLEGFSIRY